MELPPLQATIRDPAKGVEYKIHAYRPITRNEAILAIAHNNAAQKRKPKRGSVVTIITTFGAQD